LFVVCWLPAGDEEERRSAAVGPRKARKAKKAASTREDGTRQWNDAEDQVLRELMSTYVPSLLFLALFFEALCLG
jgi:hypothetical protein